MPIQLEYVHGSMTVLPLTASMKGIFPTDISRAWEDHAPEGREEVDHKNALKFGPATQKNLLSSLSSEGKTLGCLGSREFYWAKRWTASQSTSGRTRATYFECFWSQWGKEWSHKNQGRDQKCLLINNVNIHIFNSENVTGMDYRWLPGKRTEERPCCDNSGGNMLLKV